MRNLLLTLKYDGSAFHGWQVQKNALSVQEVFQKACEKVFCEKLSIKGCSRTDSGVHADMYCVSLKTNSPIATERVPVALNTLLPNEIAVYDCKEVSKDFHARYSCVSKQYVYKIYNAEIRNPFLEKYQYHYRYKIDENLLNRAAKEFIGTYDFAGFCSAKSDVEDTVRTIKDFTVTREGDTVLFTVEADGFLYNMVRILVGTLLFVAQGKIDACEIKSIIASKDRSKAGKTAPARGLYLSKVNYSEVIE